jgi:peroxiredoxin
MSNVKIGDEALAFDLPGVDGKDYTLSALGEGKEAAVVVFMCNHCPYVLAWLDRLIAVAKDYAERGVAFAGINANDPAKYAADDFAGMQTLAKEKGLPFPYLHDESQEVATAYGAERTPEVFVFDGDFRLCYHGAPDDNYDETLAEVPYLRNALDAVLAGKEPPVAETAPQGCTIKWK